LATSCTLGAQAIDAGALDAGAADGGVDAGSAGYDFTACPTDAGAYCPNDLVLWCRMEVIRVAYARGCSTDSECEDAPRRPNCLSYGCCDAPVVRSGRGASFWADAFEELTPYCASTSCFASCSCANLATRPGCVKGVCQTVFLQDGGG